jgi:hypothetical protein
LEDGDELRHAYGSREGKVAYAAATIASPAQQSLRLVSRYRTAMMGRYQMCKLSLSMSMHMQAIHLYIPSIPISTPTQFLI